MNRDFYNKTMKNYLKNVDDNKFFISFKYPKYAINKYGIIKNIETNKILKPSINNHGYCIIRLYSNGVHKSKSVHRFLIETLLNNNQFLSNYDVNHIDFNKQNNRYDNLELATTEENIQHYFNSFKSTNIGEQNISSKIKNSDVLEIRRLRKNNYKLKEIAEKFNLTTTTISDIVLRKTWKHIGEENDS